MDEPLTKEELYTAIDTVLQTATSDSVFHKRAYDSIVKLIENSELVMTPEAEKVLGGERNDA